MGRHTKAVAAFFATIHELARQQAEFERAAQDWPDDDKRVMHRIHAKRRQKALDDGAMHIPARPAYLRGLTCGARSRAGLPCGMTALFPNGRCIWHGGKSTGPRTADGRERALANLKLGRLKRGKSRA